MDRLIEKLAKTQTEEKFDIDKDVFKYCAKFKPSDFVKQRSSYQKRGGIGTSFQPVEQSGVVHESTGAGQMFDNWRTKNSTRYHVSAEQRMATLKQSK